MTLSASNTFVELTGDGAVTLFNFSFALRQASDLQVYKDKVLQSSGYAVAINSSFVGGTVTFSVAPASGVKVYLVRKSALSQDYDPQADAPIDEASLELTFDKTMMKVQEVDEQADRALRIGIPVTGVTTTLPTPEASKCLRWNSSANAIEYVTSTTIVSEGGGGGGGGGGGTVTSVAATVPAALLTISGSPVTTSGTLAISLASQAANLSFMSPDGSSGTPTFRAIVSADLPNLDVAKITTGVFAKARQHAATVYNDQTNTYSGTFTQDFGASGQTLVLPKKSTPGSPTQGEIWVESSDLKFQDTSGPTTQTVVKNNRQVNTTSPLAGGGGLSGDLTLSLTTVPLTLGGTNITSYTAGDILVTNNSGALVKLPLGTNGQALLVNTGNNPQFAWTTLGGGSGTVTSVAMTVPSIFSLSGSPITTSGTLAVTLASQTANFVFAAPDGSSGTPTFRALVAADLPVVTIAKGGTNNASLVVTAGVLPRGDGSKLLGLALGTANQQLRVNAGATDIEWATIGGSGTVTSVAMTVPSVFSVSGSPITTSGTLAVTFAGGQTANQVLASPDGSAGAVGLRALVAADIPNLSTDKLTSGTLPIARGGTNNGSLSVSAGVVYRGDGSKLLGLAIGTANQVLAVNSGATDVEWQTPGAGSTTAKSFVKTADEIVNNSSTMQDDNHLVGSIGASETWSFDCLIIHTHGNNSGDIDMTFTVPTGASIVVNYFNPVTSVDTLISASGTEQLFNTSASVTYLTRIKGSVRNSTNAGNLTFRFAQNAAHASDCTVLAGSYMSMVKV